MTNASLPLHPVVERLQIHLAVCRARRQNLACSLCSDLAERAALVASAAVQIERVA